MGARNLFLHFFFLCSCFSASAKEVRLYENGLQVSDYDALLGSLQPGDDLVFEDGNRFEFLGDLGSGMTSRVVKVQNRLDGVPTALRLPIRSGKFTIRDDGIPYTELNAKFLDGAGPLVESGLLPKVYRSAKGQYVQVELLSTAIGLDRFLSDPILQGNRSMTDSFVDDFAKRVAVFHSIRDLRPENIIWDGDRWRVLDHLGAKLLEGEVTPAILRREHPLQFTRFSAHNTEAMRRIRELVNKAAPTIYHERLRMMNAGHNPISKESIVLRKQALKCGWEALSPKGILGTVSEH